ncbi:hypothetical protein JMA_40590 (plasmid) [Jeotgalibacillus malaysiensis]|uniref:DUF5362 domain-containing protein n=1 Tax=Jeotgalibacillus malaysiensis TaxID=1508404 RepID=A0A0B5AXH3_9BACL|nr:DUF5362 family protein [Jeotgalibacillus malaysiensis]AJD93377.1 hypothetical protein JMA_40590 [Jeotgalibacillus malaysiensis]
MEKSFKRVSRFGKILGVLMMVSGVLSALSGIMTIVGAIPGAITVWLGYLIFQSGKEADEYLTHQTEEHKEKIIVSFSKYLYISGIMLVVSLALLIPAILFMGLLGAFAV